MKHAKPTTIEYSTQQLTHARLVVAAVTGELSEVVFVQIVQELGHALLPLLGFVFAIGDLARGERARAFQVHTNSKSRK
jgi:hypothetical protein